MMKIPKLTKKMLLVIGSLFLIAAVSTAAYAWIASNVLTFQTTVSGSPFTLAIINSFVGPTTPHSLPYLPTTMYYNEPYALNTTTYNQANTAYTGVKTNYEIWRNDGASITYDQSNPWLTVEVKDQSGSPDIFLTTPPGSGYSNFGLISDPAISVNPNNAIAAYIGPYTASAHFQANATVTVTFLPTADNTVYNAKVWVSVPP